jgi:hypothetical protein
LFVARWRASVSSLVGGGFLVVQHALPGQIPCRSSGVIVA